MANPPQGWQYPPPPYPQGPVAPGSMARPTRPTAMRRAVSLMYAGAAVLAVTAFASALTHELTSHAINSTSSHTASWNVGYVIGGFVGGIVIGSPWLWMAWKTGAGRNWARVLSTVFFGIMCLCFLAGIVSLMTPGHSVAISILILIEWGIGLAALILLWQHESSAFFASAKQARMARKAYDSGAPYTAYQTPSFAQPRDHD